MTTLQIERDRTRILFTPETGWLDISIGGSKLGQFLTREECQELATFLILSAKVRKCGIM